MDRAPFPSRLRPVKALLKVGYRCNNNCLFCHSKPHRGVDGSTEQLQDKIKTAAKMGIDMLVLSGGEPTIRNDLMDLADTVAGEGMSLGLVTNGRMLSYDVLRSDLLNRGLAYVYISIAGGVPVTHDGLAGVAGAFDQTRKALLCLATEGAGRVLSLTMNCVVTTALLDELDMVVDLAAEVAEAAASAGGGAPVPVRLKFSAVEPEGAALERFDALVPELSTAAKAVTETLSRQKDRALRCGLQFGLDAFPPCLVPDHAFLQADLWTDGFVVMSEAFEQGWTAIDENHKRRDEPCIGCSADGCPGVFRTYLDRHGPDELRPFIRRVSNSFDLVPMATARVQGRACPVKQGDLPAPDPRRELLSRDRNVLTLWRTETTDFLESQLDRIKNRYEQIYLDTQPSGGSGDFPSHLLKYHLGAGCRRCSRRPACGGVFVRARPSPFIRDTSLLDHHLRRIFAGDADQPATIIDMGSGGAPYLEAILPVIQKTKTQYVGVDPGPPPGWFVEGETAGLRFVSKAIEAFSWEEPPVDTVLSIRSWSHFRDLPEAARRIFSALRPSGTFFMVGDVPFGLLRTEARARACHLDPSLSFQHYRNPDPEEVMDHLSLYGMEMRFFRNVGPDTTNLYFLICQKPKAESPG